MGHPGGKGRDKLLGSGKDARFGAMSLQSGCLLG